ncbi:retrovirus-related pol polyprotein from transposon TNT 1-94 [Tanacetum coccineum]
MSNTKNNLQTHTSNALHNAIMEAGGKDHPPMLAPGSSETTTKWYMENYKNVSQDIRNQLDAEAEAILIILTGIDNDIYSIVDACPNACEMWKTIERLKQGESINVQDLKLIFIGNLESLHPGMVKHLNRITQVLTSITTRIAKNGVNEIRVERLARTANLLALVAQQQPVYYSQPCPTHYTQNSSTRSQQATTRNRGKAIVNSPPPIYDQEPDMVTEDDALSKEKEIDKLMALISLSFKKIYKPTNNNLRTSSNTSRVNEDNTPRINRGIGYDNQRAVNVVGAWKNVGTQVVQQSGIQCYNCKEYGHVVRECQKLKRTKDAAYHKEKMLLYKQKEAGIQLSVEQVDWRDDTNDEPEDQELEAHYLYMAKIQEVTLDDAENSGPIFDVELLQKQPESVNDTNPDEQGNTNITTDSLGMSNNGGEADQDDDDDDLARERDLLASLIEKLKCEIDESKDHNKLLESSNKTLVDKLKSEIKDFKNKNKCLESSNNHFKEVNTELAKNYQLMFKDLKKFQAELNRYHDVKYASKMEIECAKAKGELISHKMSFEKSFNEYTQKINNLNQTISEIKKELIAHKETISIISQEKEAQKRFYKTREDKEIEKVIALENKVKVLDDIVYKTGQSVQTMNMLNRNCKTSFVKPEFLKKAQRANPHLYDIGCYNDNLFLMLAPESDKMIRLTEERVIPTTSVSRPQLKSNRLEDRVMHNNSQGKKHKTKQPIVVPIITRKPKRTVNQSVATPFKKTVALESTNQKPRSTIKKQYEYVSKTCKWWYSKITPPGYKWKPKTSKVNVIPNLVEIILFIVDSGCSKNMTGNLKLLRNVTIKKVYYVEGLNHNLFSVGQFCDADLEVAFWKSTCYIHDLKGNDFLTGSRGTDLYSITLQNTTSPNPICLMAKASSSQAWLWHRRLSHLNFDTINLLSMYDIVTGLPKLKFVKYHLCSSCNLGKAKQDFTLKVFYSARAYRVYNKRTRVIVETIHVNFDELPQMASDHVSSDPVLKCTITALEQVSLSLGPQSQENVSHVVETVTTSNELDLLFSLMLDELHNGTTLVVSKSPVVHVVGAPNQHQHQNTTPSTSTTVAADTPPLNIQTTSETTSQAPTQALTVTATKNIDQAETHEENA